MDINDLQAKIWNKEIKKLTKKSDVEGLERYKEVIRHTAGVSDEIKEEYINLCEKAKDDVPYKPVSNEIETPGVVVDEEMVINSDDVVVGENTKHLKISKKHIASAIIGLTALVTVGGIVHGCASRGNQPKAPIETESNSINNTEDLEEIVEEVKVLNPNLAFDTEDTNVMIENSKTFLNDSLTKGVELKEESLDKDLESFVDFYVAMNIDEIGPGYMAKLYQDDKKSYLDMFNNFVNWAMILTDEAMMSSKDNVINISSIVSNKHEAQILQNAFNLLAEQHDNGLTGNVEEIKTTTDEFRKLLDDTLLNEESASYSTPFKVMLAYSAMNFDTLLQNYSDIKLVDDDIRKIIYEDSELHCAMALKDSSNEMDQQDLILLMNASEKNQSAVEFALQLEKKIDQMVLILNTQDFEKELVNEISVNEVISTLKNEIDLTLYKANQEYREYNDITHEINFPSKEVPKDAVIIDNGNSFVEKEELDKYDVETDGKTPQQIEDEYKEAVEEKTEKELESQKTFTDSEGKELETGVDSVDYATEYKNGYEAGSKKGAADGNALATKNSKTTGSEGYVTGYAVGYNASYEEAKKARLEADKKVEVKEEKLDTPIEQSTEVVDSGIIKQETNKEVEVEKTENTSEVKDINKNESVKIESTQSNNNVVEEVIVEEITIETPVVEEEIVVEEGILEYSTEEQLNYNSEAAVSSTNVSLSYEELQKLYYEYLYGADTSSLEEENAKTKTR